MPTWDRSGVGLFALKLGDWRNLRTELMHPGESWQPRVTGRADIAPLREPYLTPVHVTLLMIWTPLRWIWPGIITVVKDGRDSTASISRYGNTGIIQTTPGEEGGKIQYFMPDGAPVNYQSPSWELDNRVLVYNAHLKWPQDPELVRSQLPNPMKAVRLEALWSRGMDTDINKSDWGMQTLAIAGTTRELVDVRKFAEIQQRLKSEQLRNWMADDRYVDILKEVWGSSGSREVDKWPLVLDDQRGWMAGGDMMATNGDDLGARAGTMTFGIDHRLPYRFTAPEHGLFSYWIALRIQPQHEDEINPLLANVNDDLGEALADPLYLEAAPERDLRYDEVFSVGATNATPLGKIPAGQKWRVGWNQVDRELSRRGSFLFSKGAITKSSSRYESDYDHAFRTLALGHCLTRLDFHQISNSRVPDPMASVNAGT